MVVIIASMLAAFAFLLYATAVVYAVYGLRATDVDLYTCKHRQRRVLA